MGDVGRAVQAAARANPFHPVRDYFEALSWDGRSRLETWLIDYFRADDSSYIRAIGPRFLISAVARIFQPGCKVDYCLILESSQGKIKSEALRTLAVQDMWFVDRLSHIASKDAMIEMAGVLGDRSRRDGRADESVLIGKQGISHPALRSLSSAMV